MTLSITIRPFRDSETESLVSLFTESVHTLATTEYTAEQRAAWAPTDPDMDGWRQRFQECQTLVAEEEGIPLGFISFEPDGHIDLLYTAPDAARQGVASALLGAAVRQLSASGSRTFYTEASLIAAPFFKRHGFEVIEEQRVFRGGVGFRRYRMRKESA